MKSDASALVTDIWLLLYVQFPQYAFTAHNLGEPAVEEFVISYILFLEKIPVLLEFECAKPVTWVLALPFALIPLMVFPDTVWSSEEELVPMPIVGDCSGDLLVLVPEQRSSA